MNFIVFVLLCFSLRGFAGQIEIRADLPGAPNCSFLLKAAGPDARYPFDVYVRGLRGTWRSAIVAATMGRHPRQLGSAFERSPEGIRNFLEDSGFILENTVERPDYKYPPIDTDWEQFRASITPAQISEFERALEVLRNPARGRLIVLEYQILMEKSWVTLQGQNLVLIWPHGSPTATLMARWISTPTHSHLANIFSKQGEPYFLLTTAGVKTRD